ncbi:hypothetical protein ACQW02_12345 [Humitalea sp. 24SJ18S-53]|uniref:hypothetical protein n=1 Tax=Humitalea sp. 24SJ18S-53 TaxID=3422307 RepID=UPI003D67E4D1
MIRKLLWGAAALLLGLVALVFLTPYIAIGLMITTYGAAMALMEVMALSACIFAVPVLWQRRFLSPFAWLALGGSVGAYFEARGLLPGADAAWLVVVAAIAWRGLRGRWAGPLLAIIAATTPTRRIGEFLWLQHNGESLLSDAFVPLAMAMVGFATLTLVGFALGYILSRPRWLAIGAVVMAVLHLPRLLL